MKNILALVDFSEISAEVVTQSARLASIFRAKCWILHVAAPDPDFIGFKIGPEYIRDARAEELRSEHRRLADFQRQVSEQGVTCTALLVQGHTGQTILEEVEKLEVGLIVLGSHGHGAVYEIFAGSVAGFLLQKSPVPLYVLPAGPARGRPVQSEGRS